MNVVIKEIELNRRNEQLKGDVLPILESVSVSFDIVIGHKVIESEVEFSPDEIEYVYMPEVRRQIMDLLKEEF